MDFPFQLNLGKRITISLLACESLLGLAPSVGEPASKSVSETAVTATVTLERSTGKDRLKLHNSRTRIEIVLLGGRHCEAKSCTRFENLAGWIGVPFFSSQIIKN
jgi:hypothetical protein